jgi:hypothetical protein
LAREWKEQSYITLKELVDVIYNTDMSFLHVLHTMEVLDYKAVMVRQENQM